MAGSVHRAKYVLVMPDLLLQNAGVWVSDEGLILSVEPCSIMYGGRRNETEIIDWGSAVIMPGLINAHAHLELTHLRGRLTRFSSFADWISQIIANRRTSTRDDFLASAREGVRLSLAAGTTFVGDITSDGVSCLATKGTKLRLAAFEEVISFSPAHVEGIVSKVELLLRETDPDVLQTHGISPHAPYSVSAELYAAAVKLAMREKILLETHAAETEAEIEFLRTGTGEFRDLLCGIGSLPANWNPPGVHPIPYLDSIGVLGPHCILVHCNYLDSKSIATIADSGSSVVYCPRSHGFFGHAAHPIRQLLDAGVNVALGTDSLASNTTLSLLDEMRYLYGIRKDISPEEIFRAAAMGGAKAFRSDGSLGCLKAGYWADMTVLALPTELKSQQVQAQILEGAGECIATIVQGQIAWQKDRSVH